MQNAETGDDLSLEVMKQEMQGEMQKALSVPKIQDAINMIGDDYPILKAYYLYLKVEGETEVKIVDVEEYKQNLQLLGMNLNDVYGKLEKFEAKSVYYDKISKVDGKALE